MKRLSEVTTADIGTTMRRAFICLKHIVTASRSALQACMQKCKSPIEMCDTTRCSMLKSTRLENSRTGSLPLLLLMQQRRSWLLGVSWHARAVEYDFSEIDDNVAAALACIQTCSAMLDVLNASGLAEATGVLASTAQPAIAATQCTIDVDGMLILARCRLGTLLPVPVPCLRSDEETSGIHRLGLPAAVGIGGGGGALAVTIASSSPHLLMRPDGPPRRSNSTSRRCDRS